MNVSSAIIFNRDKNIGWIEVDEIPDSSLYILASENDHVTITTMDDFVSFFKYNTKYDPQAYQMIYRSLEKNDNSETFLKFSNLILKNKSFQKNKIKYRVVKKTNFIYKK